MAKRFRIWDLVLLGAALFGDLVDETAGEGVRSRARAYAAMSGMTPRHYKKAN